MEQLLYLLIIVVVLYLIRGVLAAKYGMYWWWAAILCHGLIATFLLLLPANRSAMIVNDQISLSKRIGEMSADKLERAEEFVRDNLICIDVANDRDTATSIDSLYRQPVTESITDRKKLTKLLNWLLLKEKLIDLIVIDLDLSGSKTGDCELRDAIFSLHHATGKILLAGPAPNIIDSCNQLPNLIYAGVTQEMSEGSIITSHTIYDKSSTSLAYKIYERIQEVKGKPLVMDRFISETDSAGNWSFGLNTFFPTTLISDSTLVLSDQMEFQSNSNSDSHSNPTSLTYWQLGELLQPVSIAFLDQQLSARGKTNPSTRNIIFIGNFLGSDDVHLTNIGYQHGISILINTFYALKHRVHIITLSSLLRLFFTLTIVTFLMVYLQLFSKRPASTARLLPSSIKRRLDGCINWGKSIAHRQSSGKFMAFLITLMDILLNEILLLVLFLVIFALYQFSGDLYNAVAILLYFTIVNKLLSYYFRHL